MAERKTADLPPIPERRYFTTGEAAGLVGVATSVLRFWEEEFKQLAPSRHGSRRRYERKDVLKAREIRELLYDRGFTLAGAKKCLKRREEEKKAAAVAALAAEEAEVPPLEARGISKPAETHLYHQVAAPSKAPETSENLLEELEKIRASIKNFLL